MSTKFGQDRSWYEPFQPDRTDEAGEHTIGSHKGPTYHLNIRNPQPGFVYYWEANKNNSLQRRVVEGWQFVRPSDPERWGADVPEDIQQEIGGLRMNKDVVLMRVPEGTYAELAAAKEQQSALARGGSAEEYLSRGHDAQQRLSNRGVHSDDDLYYRSPHHSESSD